MSKYHISKEKIDNIKQHAQGKKGMVTSAHPIASQVGADILEKGGNAVDAAAAVQFALNVVEPMNTGIGGSGFMMIHHAKTDQTCMVNGHARSPKKVDKDIFLDENGEVESFRERSLDATAVEVPGVLKAMETALEKFGTMSLAEVIDPAIALAEEGVPVSSTLAAHIAIFQGQITDLAKKTFLPEGKTPNIGEKIDLSDLGKAFRLIQEQGSDALYNGEIGKALVETVQQDGGLLTMDDLRNYEAQIQEPVWGEYRGHKIASAAPPSSGGTMVVQLLELLEELNVTDYDIHSWEKFYLVAEAMRLVYADRETFMGDPEFADIPVEGLLHPDYIKERAKEVKWEFSNPTIHYGNPWKYQDGEPQLNERGGKEESPETTHFSVIDSEGNVVSCTTSLERPFGSGYIVPGYGFMLNNELTDFDPEPGGNNEVQPRKRSMSTKSPSILFKDGKPVLGLGSPGGPTIISSVAQVILNVIGYGMDLKDAIEEPRIYTSKYPILIFEKGIPEEVFEKLKEKGHRFDKHAAQLGNVQAVHIDQETGTYYGAADSSRSGGAVGID
ncbi:gamma-glutamyltransferase [Pseudalkalibacillus caeni]|uniref:Glutathione hydrolase proenzyme n=1 Tax=Exobacillus caeni TaxID=2574798 RepID=A0A5R9F9K4_9BACL|nr:gamma-glutamyltransferase [Pseudalkalibacillus caeni]TLS37234.1 gamma-glutamyltransferase [Pseudalkalibacillus caeni]